MSVKELYQCFCSSKNGMPTAVMEWMSYKLFLRNKENKNVFWRLIELFEVYYTSIRLYGFYHFMLT